MVRDNEDMMMQYLSGGTVIRQATATDVEAIYALIKTHSERGIMLPRSKYKIFSRLQGFVVLEEEQQGIIGCGALVILWGDLAEIQSLVIAAGFQGQGYGKAIATSLINRAAALNIPKVLTLTYQVEFFRTLGFDIVNKDSIPRKIWGECLECPKLEECDETAMIYQITW
ncbi:N-acetyltransferase [candidate division KSB3 bacterium]|uniref:N-acetyltransferase n=1 Tax=candidate division KSB3 bacterium TaxID=2044937 RepID=A0A9D5JTA4_9BACT|nr:N-acetyltransferase [candidate division KSB3 bacterium]MBD3323689.1 N-acetyltransferase [candidate division KSB3 bacterium]